MKTVEVRPLDIEKWHNFKGKDSFSKPVTIEALVNSDTSQFAVDISEKRLKELEEITGYDLSLNFKMGVEHPFWNSPTGYIKLENKTNIFLPDRPIDEIKIGILKASSLVANSMEDYEKGLYPNAEFVIYDLEEEAENKLSKIKAKNKAIIECEKLSKQRKLELIQIIGGQTLKNQSDKFIDLKIDNILNKEGGAKEILLFLKRDKDRTFLHAAILEALQKNILRKKDSHIYYFEDKLGYDIEDVIDYLLNPDNQLIKSKILEKLQK